MSLDPSHWRSASEYAYAETLSAPDLAWEWLRRNVDYQRDYASAARKKEDPDELTRIVRQSWGLRFPGSAGSKCLTSRYLLAAGDRSRHCHPHDQANVYRARPHAFSRNRPGQYAL
jgi:hypothetical protein